jgi:serine/threonine protein kinase
MRSDDVGGQRLTRLVDDYLDAGGQTQSAQDSNPAAEQKRREQATRIIEALLSAENLSPIMRSGLASGVHLNADGTGQLGKYLIAGELGRGGFGIVYLAEDLALGSPVALKVPTPMATLDPDLRVRFLREARFAEGLDHPHIVTVHEAGEIDSVCYIAYAYCPGVSLDKWLKGRGPIDPRDAAALLCSLAEAIEHAHGQDVIHRDLKPANILLQKQEPSSPTASRLSDFIAKITDFGLAKSIKSGQTATSWPTPPGLNPGTLQYMAPEQAAGREVGRAADIHALGIILYELFTGRPPFVSDLEIELRRQIIEDEPVRLRRRRRDVPHALEVICLACLRKEPERRLARAAFLAEDLRCFLADKPLKHSRPIARFEQIWRWCRRNPALASVAGLAAALLVAITTMSTLWGIRERGHAQALRDSLDKAQQHLSENHMDHGLSLCERGEIGAGLLWLGRALERAPVRAARLRSHRTTDSRNFHSLTSSLGV